MSEDKCNEIKSYFKKVNIALADKMAPDTGKSIFSTNSYKFSGEGIISSINVPFTCSKKISADSGDGVTIFGMGIIVDKIKLDQATQALEKAFPFETVESPHKEKLKEFFESKMKVLAPNAFDKGVEITSGNYYLKLMSNYGDSDGNTSLVLNYQVKY